MKTILSYLSLIIVFSGCNEQTNGPGAATPYERWRSQNIHNYTIEQVISCFCSNGGKRVTVTVLSDTVFSVVNISDSTVVPYPLSKQYLSIDSLFGIIRYSTKDSLVYTYHAQFGYPDFLDINPQQHPVDGGALYETSKLHPIR